MLHLGVLLLLAISAAGQPQRAADLLRQAQRESAHQTPAERLASYERALAAARAEGDPWTEGAALRSLGIVLRSTGQRADARQRFLSALELYERLADHSGAGWTLHELGWLAIEDGRPEEANKWWTRGIAAFDAAGFVRGRAELMHARSFALPPGTEKRALLDEGLQLARALKDVRIESQFLYKIGEQQMWDGNYSSALTTLERAVAGFENVGQPGPAARVLIPVGRLHLLHGRSDRGLEIYQRAHDTFVRLGDKEGAVQALAAIASGYQSLGRLNDALAAQKQALDSAMKIGAQRNINLQRLQLAWLYLDSKLPRDAMGLIDAVLAGDDRFARRIAHAPLAQALFALGDYQRAYDATNEALRQSLEPTARPLMLAQRARLEERLGRPERALADATSALDEIERLRPRLVQTDPMKQGFSERLQGIFEYAIDLRARHGQAQAALEAAEQARGRAFLDLLATRQVPALADDPKLTDLRRIDSDIRQAAEAQPDGTGATSDALEKLRAAWRTADPELRSFVSAEPFSLSQLAAAAARLDSTIVDYWVGGSRTIVWVIGRDGLVTSAVVPVGSQRLAELVRDVSDAGSRAFVGSAPPASGKPAAATLVRHSASKDAWRTLHDLLIRPVAAALPQTPGALLTIVPHGPISRLSFAALVDDRGRYLLERYALHYIPAGAVLEQTGRKAAAVRDVPPNVLLVANPAAMPVSHGGRPLPPLPEAAREIQAIARQLPPGTSTALTGAAAREDRVRDALAGSSVVHFATHAVLRDDRSLDSFLALGRAAGEDDGRLTAQEVYALRLHANLVVLSACRTAAGPVTGDGIVGLTRAFFYAGTPSVVATLWNLADVSGPRVMPEFYKTWLATKDKGRALRDAQLALLARLRAGQVTIESAAGRMRLEEDPFLWAGYVLIGEPR